MELVERTSLQNGHTTPEPKNDEPCTIVEGAEPNSAESPPETSDDVENPNRPKGFSFAVLYTCILFGDFFTGYVSLFSYIDIVLEYFL